MFTTISWSLCLGLALQAAAAPSSRDNLNEHQPRNVSAPGRQYTLPLGPGNTTERANAIVTKRNGFVYGPGICGEEPFWPTGSLGDSITGTDFETFTADGLPVRTAALADQETVTTAVTAVCDETPFH